MTSDHFHVLNGPEMTGKREAVDEIAKALSFPEWFGHNLDALHDSLVDLSWLPAGEHVLIWPRPDVLARRDPQAFEAIKAVLTDAEQATGDRTLSVLYLD